MAEAPHAKGVWTGRVVPIRVVDEEGQVYTAAGLAVEKGPRTLRASRGAGGGAYTLRADDIPYVGQVRGACAIVSPDDLGAPPGAKIRVQGKMVAGGIEVWATGKSGHPALKPVSRLPAEPPGGVYIIVPDSKPEVLDQPTSEG